MLSFNIYKFPAWEDNMNLEKYNSYSEYIEKLHSYNEELFWTNCKQHNSIQIYKNYLEMFPNGKYRNEAIKKAWEITRKLDTIKGYKNFLEYFPNSPYKKEALNQIKDEEAWKRAINENSMESYRTYLNLFPNGRHADKAYEKAFKIACQLNTLTAYKEFLDLFPNVPTEYKNEAIRRVKEIHKQIKKEKDEEAWKRAINENSMESYRTYLNLFPNGRHADKAYEKAFKIACQLNTLTAYKEFLDLFPNAPTEYKNEAIRRAWEITRKRDSIKDYEEFLEYFPNSPLKEEALKRVKILTDVEVAKFGTIKYLIFFLISLPVFILMIPTIRYCIKNNLLFIGFLIELLFILIITTVFPKIASFIFEKFIVKHKKLLKLTDLISTTLFMTLFALIGVFFIFLSYHAYEKGNLFGTIFGLLFAIPIFYLLLSSLRT